MIKITALIVSIALIGYGKEQPILIPATTPQTIAVVTTPADATASVKTCSYLALGDAYTIGQSVSPEQSYGAKTLSCF